jgi:hypothetical protein
MSQKTNTHNINAQFSKKGGAVLQAFLLQTTAMLLWVKKDRTVFKTGG